MAILIEVAGDAVYISKSNGENQEHIAVDQEEIFTAESWEAICEVLGIEADIEDVSNE